MKIPYSKKTSENEDFSASDGVRAGDGCCHSGHRCKCFVWVLAVLVIVGACLAFCSWTSKIAHPSKDWQAVFLINGQVYFGKVAAVSDKTLTLKDIYYLQFVNKPLQTSEQAATAGQQQQSQQELTLIKLGNELHGPTDAMIINRDQILLTEKLGKNSKVIEAISKYISEKKAEDKK